MDDAGESMVAFLGVAADPRLLNDDLMALPASEQRQEPAVPTRKHDRLVAAGSMMTGSTLVLGAVMTIYGGAQALFNGGGAFDIVVAVVGILLVATHWGWVHLAEYVRLTIDERQQRSADARRRDWLAELEPYPRFSVSTSVLDDASTRVQRVLHRPLLTAQHTFTFVREPDGEKTYAADAPAEVIAAGVEAMRRQARLDTDRQRELWDAASGAYQAALLSAGDDQQRLAAQRAAATALSEHINASLLEPPLVE